MKNIKEILQENGIELTDEQSKAVERATLENYKTVKDYENQTDKLNLAEKKNVETTKAFDEFKKGYEGVDIEALKTKVNDLETTLTTKENDYQNEKAKMSLEIALKEKASEFGCVDFDLAKGLLNIDELMNSKDQSTDIANLFGKLKESKPILFTKAEEKPKDNINILDGVGGKVGDSDAQMRAVMGLPPLKEE